MDEFTKGLIGEFAFLTPRPSADHVAVNCPQEMLHGFLAALKEQDKFDFLSDVTALDHYAAMPRYEVLYHLYDTRTHRVLRVATPCPGGAEPECVSIVDLWPAADWHERETYDMFGIRFTGHPDLRRILMWDAYPYYPLRKEFPLAGIEVELPSADTTESTGGVRAKAAPMMGGPFHSAQHGPMSKREPRADDESWTETSEKSALAAPGVPRDLEDSI